MNFQSSLSPEQSSSSSPSGSSYAASQSGSALMGSAFLHSDQLHFSDSGGAHAANEGGQSDASDTSDNSQLAYKLVQSMLQEMQDGAQSQGAASTASAGPGEKTGAAQITPLQAAATENTAIGPSEQGHSADCGALASIAALSTTPGGTQELHSLIKPEANGDFGVTFPGDPSQKTYTVTPQELQNSNLSKGDVTTGVLALAMDDFSVDHSGQGIGNGSYAVDEMSLLTGKDSTRVTDPSAFASTIKNQLSQGEPVVAGATLSNGELHAVTVDSYNAQNNSVTWTNPWDSGQQYQQSLDSFVQAPNDGQGDFSRTTEVDTMPTSAPAATVKAIT